MKLAQGSPPSHRRVSLNISNLSELALLMGCNGKCNSVGIEDHNGRAYDKDMKYCSGSEKFFFSDSARCFCCGRRLRAEIG